MGRILVIRGGAIGDFILTLPALSLLRDNFPDTHIEILGYRHIACLADGRHYADATRSIDYGPLAAFFNPRADLDPGLVEYFGSFQQVVSYIYDPDQLFEGGLRRAGVKNLITVSPKVPGDGHAALHLARPLEQLALWLENPAARFFPSADDRIQAERILSPLPRPLYALHPGSGGEKKNWPLNHWSHLAQEILATSRAAHLLIVGGESDTDRLAQLRASLPPEKVTFLENLPLPILGAVLAGCDRFLGHDSGISHLAAAAGAPCLLLFGPTDPSVWAPANPGVRVIHEPELSRLDPATILASLDRSDAD